jgi:branched-chain amino acid transport system substrate-binding protein
MGAIGATAASARVRHKPSGEPVKLMVMGSFEGQGLDFNDIPDAAKAAAAALNKKDGINGHPVKIIVCNSGIDPNKPEECARQAVDEGVVALVGVFATDDYFAPLAPAGIPSVADYGISTGELTNPLSFPIGATAIGGTGGMGAILADQKAKKVDVAYLDLPGGAGKLAADFTNYGLAARGAPKATLTPVPINGADLQPSVQQTSDKNPQGVALALTDPEFSKWVVAYRQGGGKAKIAAAGSTVNPTNAKTLGDLADGILVSANFKPASLKTDAGVKQMLKEVNAYDKGIRLVDPSIEAWAGVHLVADALKGQPTTDAATLVAQLNQDKVWNTKIGPPVNFAQQPPEMKAAGGLIASLPRAFTTDVYYAKVKNGKIQAIGNKAHDFLQG